jgi:hypothetical protein
MYIHMYILIYIAMPENIEANNGKGSTFIVDKIAGLWCFHSCFTSSTSPFSAENKYHFSDICVGMWIFFAVSALTFPYGAVLIAIEPQELYSYLTFSMCSGFFSGSALLLHTSLPGNHGSKIVDDFVREKVCCCLLSPKHESKRILLPDTEV